MAMNHPARGCHCRVHERRRIKDRTDKKRRVQRREYQRAYYLTHKDDMIRKAQEWKAENPERYKGHMRRFRMRRKIRERIAA